MSALKDAASVVPVRERNVSADQSPAALTAETSGPVTSQPDGVKSKQQIVREQTAASAEPQLDPVVRQANDLFKSDHVAAQIRAIDPKTQQGVGARLGYLKDPANPPINPIIQVFERDIAEAVKRPEFRQELRLGARPFDKPIMQHDDLQELAQTAAADERPFVSRPAAAIFMVAKQGEMLRGGSEDHQTIHRLETNEVDLAQSATRERINMGKEALSRRMGAKANFPRTHEIVEGAFDLTSQASDFPKPLRGTANAALLQLHEANDLTQTEKQSAQLEALKLVDHPDFDAKGVRNVDKARADLRAIAGSDTLPEVKVKANLLKALIDKELVAKPVYGADAPAPVTMKDVQQAIDAAHEASVVEGRKIISPRSEASILRMTAVIHRAMGDKVKALAADKATLRVSAGHPECDAYAGKAHYQIGVSKRYKFWQTAKAVNHFEQAANLSHQLSGLAADEAADLKSGRRVAFYASTILSTVKSAVARLGKPSVGGSISNGL